MYFLMSSYNFKISLLNITYKQVQSKWLLERCCEVERWLMESFSLLVNAANRFVDFPPSWELLNVAPLNLASRRT